MCFCKFILTPFLQLFLLHPPQPHNIVFFSLSLLSLLRPFNLYDSRSQNQVSHGHLAAQRGVSETTCHMHGDKHTFPV